MLIVSVPGKTILPRRVEATTREGATILHLRAVGELVSSLILLCAESASTDVASVRLCVPLYVHAIRGMSVELANRENKRRRRHT